MLLKLLLLLHVWLAAHEDKGVFCVIQCLIKPPRLSNSSMEKMQNYHYEESCLFSLKTLQQQSDSRVLVGQCPTYSKDALLMLYNQMTAEISLLVLYYIKKTIFTDCNANTWQTTQQMTSN